MMGLRSGLGLSFGLGMLLLANCAGAQDSLDQGKSGAQLFASNCAICHKSPEGLAKAGGVFGVQSFLREHYTASRETAVAIAAYLEAVDKAAGPVRRTAPPKRAARGKPAEPKAESKPSESKPADASKREKSE